jgi:hypothetical protein
MAYGQTGTGKTFTLGKLGDEDAADRGIMVRAMEHILADASFDQDMVSVSYIQVKNIGHLSFHTSHRFPLLHRTLISLSHRKQEKEGDESIM